MSSAGKPLLGIHLVAQTTVEERLVLSRGGFISQDDWQLIFHEIFLLLLLVMGILTGGDPDNNKTRQQLAQGTVPSWAPGRGPGSKVLSLGSCLSPRLWKDSVGWQKEGGPSSTFVLITLHVESSRNLCNVNKLI